MGCPMKPSFRRPMLEFPNGGKSGHLMKVSGFVMQTKVYLLWKKERNRA
jgi:hypothetical protein